MEILNRKILEKMLSFKLSTCEMSEDEASQILDLDGSILGKLLELDSKRINSNGETELSMGVNIALSSYPDVLDKVEALIILHSAPMVRKPFAYSALTNDKLIKKGLALSAGRVVNSEYANKVFDYDYVIDNGIAMATARLMSNVSLPVARKMLFVIEWFSQKNANPRRIFDSVKLLADSKFNDYFNLIYAISIICNDDVQKAEIAAEGVNLICKQKNGNTAGTLFSILRNKDLLNSGFALPIAKVISESGIQDLETLRYILSLALYNPQACSSEYPYEAVKLFCTVPESLQYTIFKLLTCEKLVDSKKAIEGAKIVMETGSIRIAAILSLSYTIDNDIAIPIARNLAKASLGVEFEHTILCLLSYCAMNDFPSVEAVKAIMLMEYAKEKGKVDACYSVLTNVNIPSDKVNDVAKFVIDMDNQDKVNCAISILKSSPNINVFLDVVDLINGLDSTDENLLDLIFEIATNKAINEANMTISSIKAILKFENPKYLNLARDILLNENLVKAGITMELFDVLMKLEAYEEIADNAKRTEMQNIFDTAVKESIGKMTFSDEDKAVVGDALYHIVDSALPKKMLVKVYKKKK